MFFHFTIKPWPYLLLFRLYTMANSSELKAVNIKMEIFLTYYFPHLIRTKGGPNHCLDTFQITHRKNFISKLKNYFSYQTKMLKLFKITRYKTTPSKMKRVATWNQVNFLCLWLVVKFNFYQRNMRKYSQIFMEKRKAWLIWMLVSLRLDFT